MFEGVQRAQAEVALSFTANICELSDRKSAQLLLLFSQTKAITLQLKGKKTTS
jgi:hypothetical protein